MYSCISVVKASSKTVSFSYSNSDFSIWGIFGLDVRAIADKFYPEEDSKTLWGVENTKMELRYGNPLWGIVSPSAAASLNMSTLRKGSIYLPGCSECSKGLDSHENLPGADFASDALCATYTVGRKSMGPRIDYSGQADLAMYSLWQDYFRTAPTSAKILNKIWTDIAANLVLGTNSGELEDQYRILGKEVYRKVTVYSDCIQYRYAYGIPAFLALFLTTGCAVMTAYVTAFRKANPSTMRRLLEHTSTGRLLTTSDLQRRQQIDPVDEDTESVEHKPADCSELTVEWEKGAGTTKYTLGAEGWTKNIPCEEAKYGEVGTTATYVSVPTTHVDYDDNL